MTIECYNDKCKKHSCNSGDPRDEGPFCYEAKCQFEPLVPSGYTADELARAADERAAFLARRQLFEDQAKQLADECDHAAKAEPDEGLEYGPPPPGYTAEELERDNPYNQWMYES